MTGFAKHRRSGSVIATFSVFEADLLRSLAGQLVELLHSEKPASEAADDSLEAMFESIAANYDQIVAEPEDPVLRRLLPSAYRDDEEAASDFRRFTESTLREGKSAGARLIIDTLEDAGLPAVFADDGLVIDVELPEPEALTWLKSFTDIRLALATRLGIEEGDEDMWDALPETDPRGHAHAIYEWVGYLQETLVRAIAQK